MPNFKVEVTNDLHGFMIDMEAELDKIKTRGCTQLLSCYATLPTIVITFTYILFIILFWFTVGGSFM